MPINQKNFFLRYTALISYLLLIIFIPDLIISKNNADSIFRNAIVRMDPNGRSPVEITFKKGVQSTVYSFISEYKKTFKLQAENDIKISKVFTDELTQTHYRLKQYYKNIELSGIQYLLHF